MSSIDERVVEMKFDNAQFERGVSTTTKSLEHLKQSLNFDGAAKGLDGIAVAANKFNLGPIGAAVDHIASKFNMMSVVAVTAISNIVNKAINAGTQISKSLTIDPVKQGFDEYEMKLGAIQTIMAGSGASMAEVNKQLEILNDYADTTIYSFGDMTQNIGKFTNAGISLKDSVGAIKGVANVAALSGANANEASRAMFNFSQALSAGFVRLEDWRSIELANMGTKEFKQQLIDAAVATGSLEKAAGGMYKTLDGTAFNATKNFNLSLQDQWMTTEALTKTLNNYSNETTDIGKRAKAAAQDVKTFTQFMSTLKESIGSGWASSFEIIFGNLEEAKILWTDLNNTIGGFVGKMADARNKILGDWKALGGRTALIEGIKNAFNALMAIIKPIKDAFRDIFPAMTGARLFEITKAFLEFTKGLKIGIGTATKIQRIFQGVFAVLDIGWMVLKMGIKTLADVFGAVVQGSGGFLDFAASIGDWLLGVRHALKTGQGLSTVFGKIGVVLIGVVNAIKNFGKYLAEVFSGDITGPAGDTVDRLKARFAPLGKLGDLIAAVWGKMGAVFKKVVQVFAPIATKISEFFGTLGDKIRAALQNMDFSLVLDGINTGLFAVLVLAFKKFLGNFGKGAEEGEGLIDKIKGAFDGLTETMQVMQANLKANVLLKIAGAIALLTASVVALSLIDSGALTKALTAITVMFLQLFGAMAIFEKITAGGSFTKMPLVATSLILLSVAILILTAAVKNLAELNWEELAKGLIGVGGLLGALALFTKFAAVEKGGIAQGAGLILLGLAIKILASAVEDFAAISWEGLGKGMASITAILALVAGFSRTAGGGKSLAAASAGLVLIAIAMKILASAVGDFASLSWEELGKGMATMATALGLIVAALRLMPEDTIVSAAALVAVAVAMKIMASALGEMGKMSWEEIAKGLVTLAASMGIIAGALFLMKTALPGAAALVVVAGALAILTPVLMALGSMSWEEIGKSLVMLAGALTIIGLAGLALTPVIPSLIGLGLAIALIGVGAMAVGVGLLAFSAGLTALSVAGAAGAAGLTAIFAAIIGLIPMALKAVGEGLILLAMVIANSGPQLMAAMTTLILSMLGAIKNTAPQIIDTIVVLVNKLVSVLVTNVPKFVVAGMQLITGILTGIAQNLGKLIKAATDVIVAFLKGIAASLPRIIQAGVDLIIKFVEGMAKAIRDNSKRMNAAGLDLAKAIVQGMANGISQGATVVKDAAVGLAKSAFNAAKNFLGINSPSKEFAKLGMYSSQGLAGGIRAYSGLSEKASESMGHDAINALRKSISGMSDLVGGDINLSPTIRPVLDLTSIKKGASLIPAALGTPRLELGQSTIRATSIANSRAAASDQALESADITPVVREVNYTQNNYSPKALTSMEIYRQTRNQISTVKEALNI